MSEFSIISVSSLRIRYEIQQDLVFALELELKSNGQVLWPSWFNITMVCKAKVQCNSKFFKIGPWAGPFLFGSCSCCFIGTAFCYGAFSNTSVNFGTISCFPHRQGTSCNCRVRFYLGPSRNKFRKLIHSLLSHQLLWDNNGAQFVIIKRRNNYVISVGGRKREE